MIASVDSDMARADKDRPLRDDIRLLGGLLGEILVEEEGRALFEREEHIRALTKAQRAGKGGSDREALVRLCSPGQCDVETAIVLIRAFTLYFHVANIAEQHHRVRRKHAHERKSHSAPPHGSLAAAIAAWKADGIGPDDVRALLDRLSIELVLTAHPTEAARHSVLRIHTDIERRLGELDNPLVPPAQRAAITAALKDDIRPSSGSPTRCGPSIAPSLTRCAWASTTSSASCSRRCPSCTASWGASWARGIPAWSSPAHRSCASARGWAATATAIPTPPLPCCARPCG